MRRSIPGSRTLVTGASSGIGWHVALELARQGADVVLFARRRAELELLAEQIVQLGSRAAIIVGDVARAEDRFAALATAERELGGLDILVNNAGISAHGRFAQADAERLRTIMEVNFFAAVELTRGAIPLLQASDRPMIVNVGSILGERGIPFNSEYCASKFALAGWSESLRTELVSLGIDVLMASPGTTDTEFVAHLIDKQEDLPWKSRRGTSPAKVARAIVRGIRRGRKRIVPSFSGWALLWLNRLAPWFVDWLMRRYV